MAETKKDHNEVAELENWRIRIRKEEASSAKWEDWWGWIVKHNPNAVSKLFQAEKQNNKHVAPRRRDQVWLLCALTLERCALSYAGRG